MNKAAVLIIEDDPVILKTNCKALEMQGYVVLSADTLAKGRSIAIKEAPDLIILDVLLPDGNGLDYCGELRMTSDIPILFLSALGTSDFVIAGLQAGGDDYISKPYDMEVFLAKVEAILRRCNRTGEFEGSESLQLGSLRLDTCARRAYLNEQDLLLKPREFVILEVLIKQKGVPITAAELYKRVWALDNSGDVRTVWVHISTLRSKLGDPLRTGGLQLLSHRNSGYFLSLEEE